MTTDLWTYLKQTAKPIVLYGTGNGADKILDILGQRDITVSGIFASDGFVRKRHFRGFEVESYDQCRSRLGDMIVLMSFGSSRPEVFANVDRIKAEQEFYAPDVPVYGNNLFDSAYFERHKSELSRVRDLLSDEQSRLTLDCTIMNKLTGDIDFLRKCEVSPRDADSLISPPAGSLYLDLGAYNGDTVLHYNSIYPGISATIAVEPDIRNFRKLKENTSHIPNISYNNCLISDHDGITSVVVNKGRGTHEGIGLEAPCICIDTLLEKVSSPVFIKFDVEGNESAAIRGGSASISRLHPAMNIACYHRSEDIFELVLSVLDICPDYKVFMRHTPSIPGWDTQFYFL